MATTGRRAHDTNVIANICSRDRASQDSVTKTDLLASQSVHYSDRELKEFKYLTGYSGGIQTPFMGETMSCDFRRSLYRPKLIVTSLLGRGSEALVSPKRIRALGYSELRRREVW